MSDTMRRALAYYDQSYPASITGGVSTDPHITSLTPSTVSAAAGPTTIDVEGTGFVAGSSVEVDGAAQTTTFVDATSVTISYDPVTAGTVVFTVRNPDDSESNDALFLIGAIQDEPTKQEAEPEPEPEPEPEEASNEANDQSGGTGPKRRKPRA
jgi:hypothetical protein